jgi:hypothetical protein
MAALMGHEHSAADVTRRAALFTTAAVAGAVAGLVGERPALASVVDEQVSMRVYEQAARSVRTPWYVWMTAEHAP